MQLILKNLRLDRPLALEFLSADASNVVRHTLLPHGTVDVAADITPEDLQRQPPIKALVAAGDLQVLIASTADDFVAPAGGGLGWASYNDAATTVTAVTLVADVWTALPNDGLGAQTVTSNLPLNVTQLWDAAAGRINLSGLDINDELTIRVDFVALPTVDDADIQVRLNFQDIFALTRRLAPLNSGAGIQYFEVENLRFFLGEAALLFPPTIEVRCDVVADITVNGWYISVQRGR